MSGIRNPETRRKLLTYTPPPSLQTTVDVCRSDESARIDEAALVNNDPGHTKIDKVARKHGNVVKLEIPKHNHRCGYCGKSAHKTHDESCHWREVPLPKGRLHQLVSYSRIPIYCILLLQMFYTIFMYLVTSYV